MTVLLLGNSDQNSNTCMKTYVEKKLKTMLSNMGNGYTAILIMEIVQSQLPTENPHLYLKWGSPITSKGICAIIKEITNNVLYASKSCKSGYKKTTYYLQESQTNSQTPLFFLPCFETSVFHQWLNLRFLMQIELNIRCMLNNIYIVLFIKSRILFLV